MNELAAETAQLNDDFDGGCEEERCWTCGGDGWGIVGVDWECDDYVNGPYPGEFERCPNCGGSGLAKDCWYW
jgi:hypothetical protein